MSPPIRHALLLLSVLMAGSSWCGCSTETAGSAPAPGVPAAPTTADLPRGPAPAGSRDEKPVREPLPSAPTTFIGTDLELEDIERRLTRAPVMRFKPVGSTSTVFKATLKGSINSAFKSATADRPRGPVAEVAAYRLARCLGLNNVPPAVLRRYSVDQLYDRLDPDSAHKWSDIEKRLLIGPGDRVLGASIYWVGSLHDLGIDKGPGVEVWTNWLSGDDEIPADKLGLAAHISSMLAFDYLIGNWDRFSGGNAKGDAEGTYVYLRDHDIAFPLRMRDRIHRKVLDRLLRAERFSTAFHRRVKALSRESFSAELARDPKMGKLLGERSLAGLFDRRETYLSHVEALIELRGAQKVLVFP